MVQSKVFGKDRISFMESLCVADIQGLKENTVNIDERTSRISYHMYLDNRVREKS